MMKKAGFYKWLSGFFFAPALMHALRLIFKWDWIIGTWTVSMTWSVIILVVALCLSLFFYQRGRKCCCAQRKSED